jgi:hypothetical protein
MSQTIQIRQKNPNESENMANLDSESDVYGYLSRTLGDKLGEYIEVTLSAEDGTEVPASGVTGSGSGNYVTFDTPGDNIVGFGVHLDILSDVLGIEFERDEDGNVLNAPESVHMAFSPSTEEDYEEAGEADEDEAEALIAGDASSDEDETDPSEEAEELVELEADDLDVVDAE